MGVSALELRRRVLMAQPHKERKTGGIVSFKTHVPQVLDVSVPLSPVQAGTGDPYPPGGGVNIFDISTCHPSGAYGLTGEKNVETGEIRLHGTWTGNAVAAFRIIQDTDFPLTENAVYTAFDKNSDAEQHVTKLHAVSATVGGMVVQVGGMTNGNSYDMVFKPCVSIGTAPTEYAPYSNIRPISGHSGAAVWDDPKHGGLIKWNQLNALNAPNALTTINEDGSVTITATESTKTSYGHVSMLAETPFLSDHVYMLYTPGFFNDNGIMFYTARGSSDAIVAGNEARFFKNLAQTQTFVRSKIPAHEGTVSVTTFVMLFDLTEMFGAEVADGIYSSPYETALSWFKSLFFKEWYPFNAGEITCVSAVNGETYRHQAFTFPATVYGGRLEPAAGRVVLNQVFVSARWGDQNGTVLGNYTRKQFTGANKSKYPNYSITPICNVAKYKDSYGEDSLHFYVNNTATNNIIVMLPNDASEDTEIQVVYELAEPIIIPLTPAEIRALMGENNVFSDAGDVEVEFWTN